MALVMQVVLRERVTARSRTIGTDLRRELLVMIVDSHAVPGGLQAQRPTHRLGMVMAGAGRRRRHRARDTLGGAEVPGAVRHLGAPRGHGAADAALRVSAATTPHTASFSALLSDGQQRGVGWRELMPGGGAHRARTPQITPGRGLDPAGAVRWLAAPGRGPRPHPRDQPRRPGHDSLPGPPGIALCVSLPPPPDCPTPRCWRQSTLVDAIIRPFTAPAASLLLGVCG